MKNKMKDDMTMKHNGVDCLMIPLSILDEFERMKPEEVGLAVLYAMEKAARHRDKRPMRNDRNQTNHERRNKDR